MAYTALALGLASLCAVLLGTVVQGAGSAQAAPTAQEPGPVALDPVAPLALDWLSQDASATTSVAWGDVDGDGDLDLAVANGNGPNRLYINSGGRLHGDAPGAWTSAESDASYALAWGDVDGDGDLDLVVANGVRCDELATPLGVQVRCTPGSERLYRNDSGALTRQAVWSSSVSDNSRALALGDADGDGDLDLAVANVRPPRGCDAVQPCPLAANRLYLNQAGVFSPDASWISGDADDSFALAWGNLDADAQLELVAGGRDGVKIYHNGISGLERVPQPAAADGRVIVDLSLADMDGNGRLDVVAAGGANSQQVWVLTGEAGGASLQTVVAMTSTQAIQSLALGDYDADGYPDLALGTDCAVTRSLCRLRVHRNEQGTLDASTAWQSEDNLNAAGLAWGDVDNDGDLDLAVGAGNVANQPNRLYRNDSQVLAAQAELAQRGDGNPVAAAWADVDGDGDLDLALGFSKQCSHSRTSCVPGRLWLYVNEAGTLERQPIGREEEQDWGDVRALAWGDYDGDGDPDLAVGSAAACSIQGGVTECRWTDLGGRGPVRSLTCQLVGGQPQCGAGGVRLFRNDQGALTGRAAWQGLDHETVTSLAWGDADGDGWPDLAVGGAESCSRDAQENLICRDGLSYVLPNVGQATPEGAQTLRTLSADALWRLPAAQDTSALAWGDVDNDGDLDLMVADRRQRLRLHRNEGGVLLMTPSWESEQTAETRSLAWGDVDGDGDLDLAVANQDEALHLYYNQDGQLTLLWTAREATRNARLAWGDVDGDGDLDLAVNGDQAARLYINGADGLDTAAAWGSEQRSGGAVAWGDANGDGALELLAGGVLFHNLRAEKLAAAGAPLLTIRTPLSRGNATGEPPIFTSPQISITYVVSHATPGALVDVQAFYALRGPGQWQPATPLTGTQTSAVGDGEHVFVWNAAADGLMGRSDGVVLRLSAATRPQPQANAAAERWSNGAASAVTDPIAVRGTQVRVLDRASRQPVAGAVVFRLPKGEVAGAQPLGGAQGAYRTDVNGYLQGSGQIDEGDTLYALLPVTATLTTPAGKYRLYHTSYTPTGSGVAGHLVRRSGLQELTVSQNSPLILFDLDLSLEWDARNDGTFLEDLRQAIRRSSEVLFDVSNGQMALGEVLVYQGKGHWTEADVVLYANNSIRPRASLGGVVDAPVNDVVTGTRVVPLPNPPGGSRVITATRIFTDAFVPGQIRMGPVWDPFGESRAELQQDWWRALAHEYGHYLLYLPDNYLGYGEDGSVIAVDCQDSFMTTAYSDEYSEFLTGDQWPHEESCARTIAAMTTGRSDWQTVQQYYPMVNVQGNRSGPAVMPLEFTQVRFVQPLVEANTLPARNFDLRSSETSGGGRLIVDQGQAFLIRTQGTSDLSDDEVVALGATGKSDSIKVRGASQGDRVCVFDATHDPPLLGCNRSVRAANTSIRLSEVPGWNPDIVVNPASQLAMVLTVTVPSSASLPLVQAQTLVGSQPAQIGAAAPDAGQPLTLLHYGDDLTVGVAISPSLDGGQPRLWVEQLAGAEQSNAARVQGLQATTAAGIPRPDRLQPVTLLQQPDGPTLALALNGPDLWVQQVSGPSIAISITRPLSGSQSALVHVYRPALAVEVRQAELSGGVGVQVYPAFRLPWRTYSAFAPYATIRDPVSLEAPGVYRVLLPLDYPITSGHVRASWRGREVLSQFFLARERDSAGGLVWAGQPGYRLGVDTRLGLGPDDRWGLGPDDRWGLGPDDRWGLGPDDRWGLGPDDRWGLGPDDRWGLGPDDRWGLGPDDRWGLGVDLRGLGADRRSFDAPIASEDGQVTIFNTGDILSDPGALSLQSLASIPNRPSWLRPVGRAYRFLAEGEQQRTVGFHYLRREVPDGYEHTLRVFYSPDEGQTWQRLPGFLNMEDNLATAPADASGLYMLAAVVDLPLPTAGWNLLAYPLPEDRPVAEALQSIAADYTTVFGYDSGDLNDPWKVYDREVPAWVNDLKDLRFGDAYWISMTRPSLLQLAVAQGRPLETDVAQAAGLTIPLARRAPPAVYYGELQPGPGVTLQPGASVVAQVLGAPGGGEPCGAATATLAEDGQTLRYVVKVQAADASGNAGCGAPGRSLRFAVDGLPIPLTVPWDNTRPRELALPVRAR